MTPTDPNERETLEAALGVILSQPATLEELHACVTTRLRGEQPDRDTPADHARTWARQFPAAAERLRRTVENDVRGRFVLPGSGNALADVGNPPRWHENPVGDSEFVWSLNRLKHWPRLLRAGAISGDARFAEKVVGELDDWIAQCPCPSLEGDLQQIMATFTRESPWRVLEVGIRLNESWPETLRLLADSPLLTPVRLARFVVSAHQHGRVLSEASPKMWPEADHNHYLMESAGLLNLACLLPELHAAGEWKAHAWRELNRCLDAQLTPDGGHVEGSPHYHNVSMRNFLEVTRIATREKLPGLAAFRERVGGGLRYTAHGFRPSGTTVPWADGDATGSGLEIALWGGLALDQWELLEALRKFVPPDVFEETAGTIAGRVPELGPMLANPRPPPAAAVPFALTHRDHALDQTMFRTDWTPRALSVFFGCHTPLTPVGNGHAHIDPASFDFTALGRPLLVDPGRFTYREGADRREFKSAKSHNSLTINEREPFEYVTTWRFGPQREGRIVQTYEAPGLCGAEALNRNFAPAVHRRAVALLGGRALLVLDEVRDLPAGGTVQLWFHLDSELVAWDEARLTATSAETGRANVRVTATPGLRGELLPGRVSESTDVAHPSRRLKLSVTPPGSRSAYATLIVPFGPTAGQPEAAAAPSSSFPIEVNEADGGWQVRLPFGDRPALVTWIPAESLAFAVA